MLLLAFALGAWLAWLVGALRRVEVKSDKKAALSIAGWIVSCILFSFVAISLILSLIANYSGDWPALPARLVNFLVAPAQLWTIIAFFSGWYAYRYRAIVGTFFNALLMGALPRKDFGETGPAASPSDRGGGEPTGAAPRLAVLGLLLLIALLAYLGPDLWSRLQSFKLGNVEANFSAATQRSLSAIFPGGPTRDDTGYAPNNMITELSGLRNDFGILFGPAQKPIADHSGLSAHRLQITADRQQQVCEFYIEVALPLVKAIQYFMEQTPARDASIQQQLLLLATKWRAFSEGIARESAAKDLDDPNVRKQIADSHAGSYSAVVNETFALMGRISDPNKHDFLQCNGTGPKNQKDIANNFRETFPQLLKNGYVIAFIASLVGSTSGNESAVEYLNAIAPFLERNPADPAGEMFFYIKRHEAKYYAHWYPHDALADLQHARQVVDRMISAVTGASSERATTYLVNMRAGLTNTELFTHFRAWLLGHRLPPSEMESVDAASKELKKWLKTQSPAALMANPGDWTTGSAITLVATAYDTLAMNELMAGGSKNDFSKDRCARILEQLATSQSIFRSWSQASGGLNSGFRNIFNTLDAHRDLYESVCGS